MYFTNISAQVFDLLPWTNPSPWRLQGWNGCKSKPPQRLESTDPKSMRFGTSSFEQLLHSTHLINQCRRQVKGIVECLSASSILWFQTFALKTNLLGVTSISTHNTDTPSLANSINTLVYDFSTVSLQSNHNLQFMERILQRETLDSYETRNCRLTNRHSWSTRNAVFNCA